MTSRNHLTYKSAGVDIDSGNALVKAIAPLARATARPGTEAGLGGFGALFDPKAAGFRDPILVAATDGVGTKLKVAIETAKHETVGIDLVAMCVNDLVVQGAEPLFFLDYFATGRLDTETATAVVSGIAEGCRLAGCALIGGETAEMPGLYDGEDYDLAGFCVGAVERERLLTGASSQAGDVVLGLASSGLHSNGFSLVRRIVAGSGLGWDTECPFAPGRGLAQELLTPTRIYVPSCLAALKSGDPTPTSGTVKALAHITGGGLLENLPRVLPEGVTAEISAGSWPIPPVFGWLARMGGVPPEEMLRTFNCGLGMLLVTSPEDAPALSGLLADCGEKVFTVGCLVPSAGGEAPAVAIDASALDWSA